MDPDTEPSPQPSPQDELDLWRQASTSGLKDALRFELRLLELFERAYQNKPMTADAAKTIDYARKVIPLLEQILREREAER